MRTFDISNYTIVKAGLPASLETVNVFTLIQMMQKNEKYVYWLQRKNSDFETQIPAVNVNGSFYQPSFKLEKAIFRHIRLTRNFQNYELMENPTPAISLIASPKTRVSEFKVMFSHEYPQLCANDYFRSA